MQHIKIPKKDPQFSFKIDVPPTTERKKTMNPYCHLTINEREIIFLLHEQGKSLGYISKQLNRAKSTILRELEQNAIQEKNFYPSKEQEKYQQRKRIQCGRKRKRTNTEIISR